MDKNEYFFDLNDNFEVRKYFKLIKKESKRDLKLSLLLKETGEISTDVNECFVYLGAPRFGVVSLIDVSFIVKSFHFYIKNGDIVSFKVKAKLRDSLSSDIFSTLIEFLEFKPLESDDGFIHSFYLDLPNQVA